MDAVLLQDLEVSASMPESASAATWLQVGMMVVTGGMDEDMKILPKERLLLKDWRWKLSPNLITQFMFGA